MTNYEKLCEDAGIPREWLYTVHQFNNTYICGKQALKENKYLFKERKTAKVKNAKKVYPEFTAEKQIELIKLILTDGTLAPMHLITEGRENKYIIGVHGDYHISHVDFSEALAGLALQLIEAGELDKEEVRKVLE